MQSILLALWLVEMLENYFLLNSKTKIHPLYTRAQALPCRPVIFRFTANKYRTKRLGRIKNKSYILSIQKSIFFPILPESTDDGLGPFTCFVTFLLFLSSWSLNKGQGGWISPSCIKCQNCTELWKWRILAPRGYFLTGLTSSVAYPICLSSWVLKEFDKSYNYFELIDLI